MKQAVGLFTHSAPVALNCNRLIFLFAKKEDDIPTAGGAFREEKAVAKACGIPSPGGSKNDGRGPHWMVIRGPTANTTLGGEVMQTFPPFVA